MSLQLICVFITEYVINFYITVRINEQILNVYLEWNQHTGPNYSNLVPELVLFFCVIFCVEWSKSNGFLHFYFEDIM